MTTSRYTGRFAPSPTGPLHAGSLAAALASWLDARAHGGQWLLRIEDVDTPRCKAQWGDHIVQQLAQLGLMPDAPVLWQSTRHHAYQQALDSLKAQGLVYRCTCSRRDIETALALRGVTRQRHGDWVYPGTCRNRSDGTARGPAAWRLNIAKTLENTPDNAIIDALAREYIVRQGTKLDITQHTTDNPAKPLTWCDRRLGPQQQNLPDEVGDFVLQRADGCWAYQLAVVVDDAAQGITHVVRGEDLADNTPRQILLQQALGLPRPHYLHTPLVMALDGQKLSKQNGAAPLDVAKPLHTLNAAAQVLNLPPASGSVPDALTRWVAQWQAAWGKR